MRNRSNLQKCKCDEWKENIRLIDLSVALLEDKLKKRFQKFKYCPYCANKLINPQHSLKKCAYCGKKMKRFKKIKDKRACYSCYRETVVIMGGGFKE